MNGLRRELPGIKQERFWIKQERFGGLNELASAAALLLLSLSCFKRRTLSRGSSP